MEPTDPKLPPHLHGVTDKVRTIPLSQATPLRDKQLAKGKPVATVYKHVIKTEWVRSFGFVERIKILFGANLVVMIGTATQHNPGVFQPLVLGKVTDQTSADNFMKHIIETMIEERAPKSPVVAEPEQPEAAK